jgi:tRNA U34 5-carboxymethylaminomethyl modifying GTPase MnmE/TrmE
VSTDARRNGSDPRVVIPLGVFGVIASQLAFQQLREELEAQVAQLPDHERSLIAKYLRSGAIVFALMESTRDILHDEFRVAGGSAVLTDGTYYWRLDAADYVERYGIGLPEEFLSHGRSLRWLVPHTDAEEVLRIDRYLSEHARRLQSP